MKKPQISLAQISNIWIAFFEGWLFDCMQNYRKYELKSIETLFKKKKFLLNLNLKFFKDLHELKFVLTFARMPTRYRQLKAIAIFFAFEKYFSSLWLYYRLVMARLWKFIIIRTSCCKRCERLWDIFSVKQPKRKEKSLIKKLQYRKTFFILKLNCSFR